MIDKNSFGKQTSKDRLYLSINFFNSVFFLCFFYVFIWAMPGFCWWIAVSSGKPTYYYVSGTLTLLMLVVMWLYRDFFTKVVQDYKVIGGRDGYISELLENHLVGYNQLEMIDLRNSNNQVSNGYDAVVFDFATKENIWLSEMSRSFTKDNYFLVFERNGIVYIREQRYQAWYKATK